MKKNINRNKKIKPDEYYNNGMFEIARFGKVVQMRNTTTPEMHKQYMEFLAKQFDSEKEQIDQLVEEIRGKVEIANPENLLNFIVSMNFLSMINKTSEIQYSGEECLQMRAVEYIQSVLVSCENKYKNSEEDQSILYTEILGLSTELYGKMQTFYHYWSAKMTIDKKITDDDVLKYIVESQMMGLVRGNRYQEYQIPFLKSLILPHDDAIQKAYGISGSKLIEGLEKLEYSLSMGKVDAIKDMHNMMDAFEKVSNSAKSESELKTYVESARDNHYERIQKVIGLDLYNVKKVTFWDDKIIDSLSYEMGEDKGLFEHEEYAGWPIWNLPVQRKPFIKINKESYCFDYYTLFDNIYRSLQKSMRENVPEYSDQWSRVQQVASETMVEDIFKKLLPGSKTYRDNYYPKNKSLKECAENDVMITYGDVLIIVEVKAGSFTYTPALTDYQAHIRSFKTLIEKADDQCRRTIEYIKNNDVAVIYDHDKQEKIKISKEDFSQIYSFCVTVDDFNAFTAKAEKIGFINLKTGTIAISINDLWVYGEYFESPVEFIHFLKQRSIATTLPMLALNDELDHLGMYIKHNVYSIKASEFGEGSIAQFQGYREDLDNYFVSLHNAKISYEKPVRPLPDIFGKILSQCEQYEGKAYPLEFTNFMLDFDSDEKERFENGVIYALKREKEIQVMFPMITFGDLRYCLYVEQPGIKIEPEDKRIDYIYAAMLKNNQENYYMIYLKFDEEENFSSVDYRFIAKEDIPENRIDELNQQAEKNAQSRAQSFMLHNDIKKVYPNETCP